MFKWGPGYQYVTHEPPRVHDASGRDLRSIRPVSADWLAARGIYLFHYCHLFPWQMRQKALIYQDEEPEELGLTAQWAAQSFFRLDRPYHVERHYQFASWLERYAGDHPPEVLHMMADARSGRIPVEIARDSGHREAPWPAGGTPLGRACFELSIRSKGPIGAPDAA